MATRKPTTKKSAKPRAESEPGGVSRPTQELLCEQKDLLAWSYRMTGLPVNEIARELNVHPNTVNNRCKRIRAMIDNDINIGDIQKSLLDAVPLFAKSIVKNLNDSDPTVTLGFGRGMGIFVDRNKIDIPITNLSDDELARRISDRLKADAES